MGRVSSTAKVDTAQGEYGSADYQRGAYRGRLAEDEYIDAREVELHVKEGCVRLEGVVPERHMKHAIEDVAAGCWGVRDVENRIRVPRREVFGIGI